MILFLFCLCVLLNLLQVLFAILNLLEVILNNMVFCLVPAFNENNFNISLAYLQWFLISMFFFFILRLFVFSFCHLEFLPNSIWVLLNALSVSIVIIHLFVAFSCWHSELGWQIWQQTVLYSYINPDHYWNIFT